jgi:multiple sugar transport system permease protein
MRALTPQLVNSTTPALPAGRRELRKASRKRVSVKRLAGRAAVYLITVVLALVFVLPFLWMLNTSLAGATAILSFAENLLPRDLRLANYAEAWTTIPFPLFVRNTVIIVALVLIGQVISCSLVAFGFARISFKGSKTLFIVLISTMMVPIQVTIIPTYILFAKLGWLDTFLPLTVPAFFGGSAFFVFLLRQFFMTIPRELDEAATIDGCSLWGIFWRIILPLSKPALAAVVVFAFVFTWNDFLGPLIYLQTEPHYTLALGLKLFSDIHIARWSLIMAASVITLIPVLIVFFLAQRYFVEGIVLTGVKE